MGSVLSFFWFFFFLFAVYLDGLLVELSKSGVGCHWGISFLVLLVMQMMWCYWLHVHQL